MKSVATIMLIITGCFALDQIMTRYYMSLAVKSYEEAEKMFMKEGYTPAQIRKVLLSAKNVELQKKRDRSHLRVVK